MTKKKELLVDKKIFINSLFINNIKYVDKYSDFVAESLSLCWLKFNETTKKDRYIDKIQKNIEKVKKVESKQLDDKYIQEIMISNLLLINDYLKLGEVRYSKRLMEDIQKNKCLSDILEFLFNEYLLLLESSFKKDDKSSNVVKVKEKVDKKKKQDVVSINYDKSGKVYVHIDFINGKMILNKKSFYMEVMHYKDALVNGNDCLVTGDEFSYSSFEKRRRVYIRSMYELDMSILSLSNKIIDITYPIDRVFKCAKSIIDNIYKELVNYDDDMSVLNNLMIMSVDSYGSSLKLEHYSKLVDYLAFNVPNLNDFVKDEIIDASNKTIVENGYKDFRNISGIVPSVEDILNAVNDNIIKYMIQNSKSILNKLEYYTKYMNINDYIRLYVELRNAFIINRCPTKMFIELQKNIVFLISNKFNLHENYILSEYIKEEKLY